MAVKEKRVARANAPAVLPEGWRMVRFGDVVRNVDVAERQPLENGLERYVGLDHLDPESLHIKRWGLIEEGTSFTRKFVEGQVLFGKRRAYQRKAALAEFDGICSGDILVFEPQGAALIPELLPFIVQSDGFFAHALGTSAGSLSPRTKWKDLAEYEFALPPKDEQRRIADILWAADDTIQRLQSCAVETAKVQSLYLKSRLSENQGSGNRKEVSLEDVCTIQNGQVDPTVPPYSNMIHIAPDDIESKTGRILEKKTAAEDGVSSGNYAFNEEAILYSKIRPNLCKVAFPKFAGVCSADVYPVYPKTNILPEVLFYVLLSEDFTSYAVANSVRSAIPKINRHAMSRYTFKLPPLNEQKQLSTVMRSFTAASQAVEEQLSTLQSLKKGLLSRFLTGTHASRA